MKFLWSMRNRKKPCKTLVYGLLSGAFLTLQPKAWQKSLILLVIVTSQVSDYSGTHVPQQSCRGMNLSKNLIWSMGAHAPVPARARTWKGALVFSRGLMWGFGFAAGRIFDAEKLTSARGLAASLRQLWGLCVGCRGGRRDNTALSPAWAALLQCPPGPGPASALVLGLVGDTWAWFRSFGFERQCYRKVFMCSYLGRSSSNGLTRYL